MPAHAITGSEVAYKYALSGVLRSGTGRSNYTSARGCVSIAGVHYASGRAATSHLVLFDTISIAESHGAEPNTCTFRVRGFEPSEGQEVIITLGSQNNADRLFAGNILTVQAVYVGTPANAEYVVSCIDYSWQLTRYRVTKRYTSESATAIAQDLIGMVTGFTSTNVSAGLATIDEMSFTFDTIMSALQQLANRIGGFVKVDYNRNVYFGTTITMGTNPVTVTDAGLATMETLAVASDLSQVITRAYQAGGGSNAAGAAEVGDDMIAVEDPVWYNPAGGQVLSGPQVIEYGGVVEGGAGTLVGPGVTPTGLMAGSLTPGSGVDAGFHLYAYTFVTGAGETLPSTSIGVDVGTTSGPTAAPTVAAGVSNTRSNDMSIGDSVAYSYSYSHAASKDDVTQDSARSSTTTVTVLVHPDIPFFPMAPIITVAPSIDVRVKWIHVWKSVNGGATQLMAISPSSNKGVSNTLGPLTFADGGSFAISHSAATLEQVALSGIGIGPSGTTSRKLYRSKKQSGTDPTWFNMRTLATIADNTTTTYTDSAADASIGLPLAPTSDTSGLTQPSGQVLAGEDEIPVAGAGAFSSTGGLAVIGNGQQIIKYTGISGNTLTGIPTEGAGSITAAVSYNSTITVASALTGIATSGDGSILYAIAKGDQINILVQVDNESAQTILAALIGGSDDGVIQDYQTDGRISEIEAIARALETVERHGLSDVRITGVSRDLNMRAGRSLTLTITHPTTVATLTFVLQRVTISNFQTAIPPQRSFEAADTYFGFTDVIRIARKGQAA